MANLRIKDQYTNLLVENGSILLTTDTPTDNFRIGDSKSQIGVASGKLCLNQGGTTSFYAGLHDRFRVPIDSNGSVTRLQSFLDFLHYTSNAETEIVPNTALRYKLDDTDSTLTRLGGDDFRIAPACPEAIGSQFNGTDQGYTANGDSSVFDGKQDEFTFTFWVNSNIQTETVVFLRSNFPTAAGNGFQITTKASGVVTFSSDTASQSTFTINDGKWHFITVRYNSGSLFFGKDAIEESGIVRTNNTWATPGTPQVSIGTNQGIAAFYNGAIDDIRFYDRSLSANEITSLYNYTCDFNPSVLTSPTWYDAQDQTTITEAAGEVSQWDDKGVLGLNLTQGTGANQPTTAVSSINGLNALDFDTDDYISNTAISASLSQAQLVVIGAFNTDAVRAFQHLVILKNSVTSDIFSIRENEAVGTLQGKGTVVGRMFSQIVQLVYRMEPLSLVDKNMMEIICPRL